MDVALERLPNAVAKVSVTIEPQDFGQAVDRAFKSVASRYNIPGFRRGKAPRKIFERYVGRGVLLQEAAQQLVDRHYLDALQQVQVQPLGQPHINIVTLEEDKPFQFDIEVESKPQVELGSLDDVLTEPLIIPELTEEDVAKELEAVAKSQAQLVPVEDDPVSMGDHVVLNLKGYLADNEEEDDNAEPFVEDDEYAVEIGSGMAVEGLETQLIGLKLGEPQTIRLTYPDNHPDVSLKGRDVRFEITVTDIKRPDVPPIDDDLATTLGFDNEEALREAVKERVSDRLAAEARNDRLGKILGKLKERLSFDLPPLLVERAILNQLQELDNMLRQMGANLDDYLESRQISVEQLREEMRPQAQARVKEELILEAVAAAQNLTVSDDEVVEQVQPMAEAYRQPVNQLVQVLQAQGDFEVLRLSLLIAKASEYLATTVVTDQEQ
ncbi:MAG: trigger factor [Sulfobacillus acidophilus]|uniref:Trigger factor n=1 Tax=Sulfobacillus acidophilus TaxID=53633 RepID=A0A2T2WIN3_9FIRM|nr:MAG: trigger factor [Sulfobacillus acidophilus]